MIRAKKFQPRLQVVQSGQDLQSLLADAEAEELHHALLTREHVAVLSGGFELDGQDEGDVVVRQISSSSLGSFCDSLASGHTGLGGSLGYSGGNSSGTSRSRAGLAPSLASSTQQYADPAQTLVFLDWDDTLFPTTELFDRWQLPDDADADMLTSSQLQQVCRWRHAVVQYLHVASALSDKCVIVTNSERPWVADCVRRFAPEMARFFDGDKALQVVYAGEALKVDSRSHACSSCGGCFSGWQLWLNKVCSDADSDDDEAKPSGDDLILQKMVAMQQACEGFYSRYPGQTWKNVLSFGDMRYEHAAVKEVASNRRSVSPSRERLRAKAVLVPARPALESLVEMLDVVRLTLQSFVRYDGDVDLDLRRAEDPARLIARALNKPMSSPALFARTPSTDPADDFGEALGHSCFEVVEPSGWHSAGSNSPRLRLSSWTSSEDDAQCQVAFFGGGQEVRLGEQAPPEVDA